MKGKLIKFVYMPWSIKLLLFEAFFLMGAVRLAVLVLPFGTLAQYINKTIRKPSSDFQVYITEAIFRIKWAVHLVSPYTPWQSKCLVKALAARIMLSRRRIGSTLFLGVAKDGDRRLLAHAWLKCGGKIITGEAVYDTFTAVAQFSNEFGGNL